MSNGIMNTLDALRFTRMIPEREKRFREAGTELPRSDYAVNRLAASLHPGTLHLKVRSVREEGKDCRSYVLEPDAGRGTAKLPWFDAGQYISVQTEYDGRLYSRPYSLLSSPEDALRGYYEIAVKRVPGGIVSNAILDSWKAGTEVTASEPRGTFTIEPLRDEELIVLAAGGSGITPFLSMAKAAAEGTEDRDLLIFAGSRTLDEAIGLQRLREICALTDRVRVVTVLSEEEREGCAHGFISPALIEKYTEGRRVSLFVCGPEGMYRYFREAFRDPGPNIRNIRYEASEAGYRTDCREETFRLTVQINGETKVIPCRSDQTLLRALEEGGIPAASSCRSGECGFCLSRLISGSCHTPARRDHRREADSVYGFIHPCCSYPESDLTIEIAAE